MPFLGVVLSGGSSRRMGVDKAALPTPSGPLAGIPAAALRDAGCDPVVLVGGDDRSSGPALGRELGLGWIPDREPGSGPLGGVATVATAHPDRRLAVCACDLPDLRAADLVPLLDPVRTGAADLAVYDLDGRPQWSIMALGPAAAAALAVAFARGERSLHGAVASATSRPSQARSPMSPDRVLVVAHLDPISRDRIRDADRVEDLPRSWRSPNARPGTGSG